MWKSGDDQYLCSIVWGIYGMGFVFRCSGRVVMDNDIINI